MADKSVQDKVWEAINALAEAQRRSEERWAKLEKALAELTEAQQRTEQRLEELAEAQQRTEQRVEELAQAQRRTEEALESFKRSTEASFAKVWEAIDSLAEAQQRTEQRVEELAQAQRRTEERVSRLEEAVARLAEAQRRTEEALESFKRSTEASFAKVWKVIEALVQAQRRTEEVLRQLRKQVGHLTNLVGGELEVDAEELLVYALEEEGYRPLGEPQPFLMDGEVDVAVLAEAPDGTKVWALVEAKLRVRLKEFHDWLTRLSSRKFREQLAARGVTEPLLVYMYGLRIYPEVEKYAQEEGIGLLTPRGIMLSPRLRTG